MTVVLFVLTVAVFIGIEVFRMKAASKTQTAGERISVHPFSDIRIPQGLFLGQNHAWARLTASGEMQLGMDEFLSQALGGADRVELPSIGQRVGKGRTLAVIHRGGRSVSLESPVEGEVLGVNQMLERSGRVIEEDPYGSAWMVRIWPDDHASALGKLRVGNSAVQWLRRETQRFCDFLTRRADPDLVGMAMADGAHPVVGAAQSLDNEAFSAFVEEFVQTEKISHRPGA